MSCGLEFLAGFIIGSNRRCSSVMETQLSVHHRSLITRTRIRFVKVLDMKFHDLNTDHVSFIYDLDEELNVEVKNLVRKLLRKRTLSLAKALP